MKKSKLTIERVRIDTPALPPGGRDAWVRAVTEAIEGALAAEPLELGAGSPRSIAIPRVQAHSDAQGNPRSTRAQARVLTDAVRRALK